jgi:hypothetical protein
MTARRVSKVKRRGSRSCAQRQSDSLRYTRSREGSGFCVFAVSRLPRW